MIKDLKHIIKKIIIGVIIALCIIFFKPYIAFAQTTSFGLALYGDNDFSSTSSFMKYKIFTLNFDSKFTGDPDQVSMTFYYRRSSQNKGSYVVFRDELKNRYFVSLLTTTDTYNYTITDYNGYGTTCDNCVELYSGSSGVINQTHVTTPTYTTNNGHIFYGKFGFSSVSTNNLGLTTDNYKIIDTNIKNLTIDNIPWEEYYSPPVVIPDNYSKVDMFNKYAVMFYAKDYRNVPTSCINYRDSVETDENGNVNVIQVCDKYGFDFDFYYKGKFNQAFVQSSQLVRVYNPVELEYTDSILNYKFTDDVFNSFQIMFYNTNDKQITSDDGNVVLYNGDGEIWYNSDLYNYILIDDYNTIVDTNICYITYLGVDGCVDINTKFPTSHDTQNVYEKESSDLLHNFRTDLHGLSSIITIPLTLLNQIQSGSCYDLVLPLPFVNKDLRLPCMTTFYSRFPALFNLYQIITFGLVSYYVCVNLLSTIKRLKDVDNDEIEVVEL